MWIYTKWHIIWHEFTIYNNKYVWYYGVITAGYVLSEWLFVIVLARAEKKTFFWFYLSKYNKLEPTDATKRRLWNTANISFLCELEKLLHILYLCGRRCGATHNRAVSLVCALYYSQINCQINKNDRYFWLSIKFNKFLWAQMILSE